MNTSNGSSEYEDFEEIENQEEEHWENYIEEEP